MSRSTSSIAVPVVAAITVISRVLMGLAGLFSYGAIRGVLMTDLRHYSVNLADHVASALTHPVWNFDREQVDRVLASVLEIEDVDSIAVTLPDATAPEWDRRRPEARTREARLELPPERRSLAFNGSSLGVVAIQFSTRRVDEVLDRFRWLLIGAVVGAEVCMVIGVFVWLRRLVLSPLQEIVHFAVRHTAGTSQGDKLQGFRFRGELEELRTSLLSTVTQLEQRQAELVSATRRLEAERSKFQTCFRLAPTGIAIVDADFNVVATNPALERIMRLAGTEFAQGRHLAFRYTDPSGRVLSREELPSARAIRTQSEIVAMELHVETTTGAAFWIAASAAPLPGYGAAVVVADISERKGIEARIAQQLDELKRWQQITLGREARIQQLKTEVNLLRRRLGESAPYQVESSWSQQIPQTEARP